MAKKCPTLRPAFRGAKRSFIGIMNGVAYSLRRDVLSGDWQVVARIGNQTRPIGGPGAPRPGGYWPSKAAALRAICSHVKFYRKHFKR